MPGALRKPRIQALKDSRFGRYLTYAVGETLLIFVGITLAVAFERSAERRREAALADGLLTVVRQDLEANVSELERNVAHDESVLQSIAVVLPALESESLWSESLGVSLLNAMFWSSPFLTTSGYESLKQNGTHSVSDASLRSAVVRLFERHYVHLVGDHDRYMWEFQRAVTLPMQARETVRGERADTGEPVLVPRDLAATRARGELRSVLLEHRANLSEGIQLRKSAVTETRRVIEGIDAFLGRSDD